MFPGSDIWMPFDGNFMRPNNGEFWTERIKEPDAK
jgi:hypothetical protein